MHENQWTATQTEMTVFANALLEREGNPCCLITTRGFGDVLQIGNHAVKSWSSTQPTITLSRREAELHGVVKAGANGMGMLSLLNDLGVQIHLNVWTDSTATQGICGRQGLGKITDLDV